jgi:hypothetical protein
MVFKIGKFRKAHEKFVKDRYQELGVDSISLYCACSGCPVLAAYSYCREFDPDNIELTKRIENAKMFYGVTEVVEE